LIHRGIVLDKSGDHIIVLTRESEYFKLKKKGDIEVGKEIMFLEEDILREREGIHIPKAIAAAIIIIALSWGMVYQFGIDLLGSFRTYAVVSLDINPSLQFEVNKRERVRKVIPLDEDANSIIDSKMIGMDIEEAIFYSINRAIEGNFITGENNVILIANGVKKEDFNLSLGEDIDSRIKENIHEDLEVIFISLDKEDVKEAEKNHISLGKYEMFKLINEGNPEKTLKDIKETPVSELIMENREYLKGKIAGSKGNGGRANETLKEKNDKEIKEETKDKKAEDRLEEKARKERDKKEREEEREIRKKEKDTNKEWEKSEKEKIKEVRKSQKEREKEKWNKDRENKGNNRGGSKKEDNKNEGNKLNNRVKLKDNREKDKGNQTLIPLIRRVSLLKH